MIVKKKNFFELKSDNDQYNKEEGILKNNNLPFIPQKLFSNVFDLKEDSFIFEKTLFLDHSISIKGDESSLNNQNEDIISINLLGSETFDNLNETPKIDFNLSNSFISYKKNRNNLKNNFLETQNNYSNYNFESIKSINCNSFVNSYESNYKIENNINSNIRCDSLLIKFKSYIGKWFIKNLNNKLKLILKRKIKLFSFNFKKFTIIVSYSKNKKWLDEKIKDLLVLGDDSNQIKNKKALKSIFNKNFEEINKIKEILNLTYRKIIELFYLSEDFIIFKQKLKIKELNDNFYKIMNISLFDNGGLIKFFEMRKGNTKKK
jgi:hypothetical protein